MNTAYAPRSHTVPAALAAEWADYEAANARAKDAYYTLRDYVETWQECDVCGDRTAAHSGLHRKCEADA